MKKALLLFLSLVLALSMLTILSGCGDKVTQGLVFESNGDGTCTWTGMGSCADTEVFVPDQNQGEMVTAVGENVLGEGSLVTAVDLPDTVKTIGEGAFADSGELTTIDLGNGLETIERDAFAHCEKLQSVKFPPSLRTIGRYAFDGAVSMTEIVLPEGVTTVEEYAFVRTSNVKKISLPASLHDLVSYCYDFTSLEELEWENAIQYYCLSVDNNYISSVNKEAYPLISYAILAADEDKSA